MVIDKQDFSYKKKGKRKESINMTVDLRTFDIFCRFVISTSRYVRSANLLNLKAFIDRLEPSSYENDIEKVKRVKFIKKVLEARLEYNIHNRQFIAEHVYTGLGFDIDFIDIINDPELNSNEVDWVEQILIESVKYYFVYDDTDEMLDLCTRIKTSDYNHRGQLIQEFQNKIDKYKNQFRMVEQNRGLTDMSFSLRDGVFESSVTETYNLVTSPSRRLLCGMQGLNEMTSGGFEAGRVYMLLGITGVGKSVTLLNLLLQLRTYNKYYKTKDPTKTPCIVLLTMENTVVETITRMFDIAVQNSIGMINYEKDEVIRKLREEGHLKLTADSPIDIVIKYKANRSVDTSYLYTLCDDLEDDGYEVICLIQDHVKRIRSIAGNSDLRIELGDVVNEFKVFAAEKDIPVITNSHLNRDASKIVEENDGRSNKSDITMKLGKSNAGESLLMLDNLDGAIIINVDYDDEGNKYMAFKKAKMREKTDRNYFVQPFEYGNGIRLLTDFGGEPQYRDSLHRNRDINRVSNVRTTSTNILTNQIDNIVAINKNPVNTFDQVDQYQFDDDDFIKPNIIIPFKVDKEYLERKKSEKEQKLTLDSLRNLGTA